MVGSYVLADQREGHGEKGNADVQTYASEARIARSFQRPLLRAFSWISSSGGRSRLRRLTAHQSDVGWKPGVLARTSGPPPRVTPSWVPLTSHPLRPRLGGCPAVVEMEVRSRPR